MINLKNDNYNLSTDYSLLWELIVKNNRILGWVYTQYNCWDCVEIRNANYDHPDLDFRYSIGSRGISYDKKAYNGLSAYDDFLEMCTNYSVHFILPDFKSEKQ